MRRILLVLIAQHVVASSSIRRCQYHELLADIGAVGASVTITGTSFGSTQGSSTVKFNGTAVTTIGSWSATSIVATVPTGATTGNVVVNVSGVTSNGVSFHRGRGARHYESVADFGSRRGSGDGHRDELWIDPRLRHSEVQRDDCDGYELECDARSRSQCRAGRQRAM